MTKEIPNSAIKPHLCAYTRCDQSTRRILRDWHVSRSDGRLQRNWTSVWYCACGNAKNLTHSAFPGPIKKFILKTFGQI